MNFKIVETLFVNIGKDEDMDVKKIFFDMDGVLCEEVPHDQDDDGIKYQNFIK